MSSSCGTQDDENGKERAVYYPYHNKSLLEYEKR